MKVDFPPFPNSKQDPFLLTSPQTSHYNCIAWAFGDDTRWYWPDSSNIYFWPPNILREEKIESFIQLFKLIGYEICDNEFQEEQYIKVAIYEDQYGKPTHAARQLSNGLWTSKLGANFDVTHTLYSMKDGAYGNATIFMRKRIL